MRGSSLLSSVVRMIAVFAAVAIISPAHAADTAPMGQPQALALEQRLFNAMIDADTRALDSLTAAEFVYNHGDGHTDTKAEMLARMRSGIAKFERIERIASAGGPHDRNTAVFAYRDVIIITGKVDFAVSMYQKPAQLAHDRLTTIWADGASGWKLLLWQATPVAEQISH